MRRPSLVWLSYTLLASCIPSPPRAQPGSQPVATSGSSSVVPIHEVAEVPEDAVGIMSEPVPGFMHGINLGNGLEAPSEGAWGVVLVPEHFKMAKAAGLDHVRLPVKFSARAATTAPYTIDDTFFKRVDWALDQAAGSGLAIIIDLHNYDELMKIPRKTRSASSACGSKSRHVTRIVQRMSRSS
jgi:Cellulase (glycosyl hydrolase family 5)